MEYYMIVRGGKKIDIHNMLSLVDHFETRDQQGDGCREPKGEEVCLLLLIKEQITATKLSGTKKHTEIPLR